MGNDNSKTAVIVAIITVLGGILTAVITNWDKIFPPKPIAAVSPTPTFTPTPAFTPTLTLMPTPRFTPTFTPTPHPPTHNTSVRLSFQTEDSAGNATYYYNTPATKAQYITQLSDHQNLYYSACELAHGTQASTCDSQKNWKKVALSLVGCTSVESCTRVDYQVSDIDRADALHNLRRTGQ